MNPARAEVFVLCCIDPRFRLALETFIQRKFRVRPEHYDLKADAGGVREVAQRSDAGKWIMRNLEIAVHKHGVRKVVLCNHIDCSYYGGASAFRGTRHQVEVHSADMAKAADIIRGQFPDLEIFAYVVANQDGRYAFEPIALEQYALPGR